LNDKSIRRTLQGPRPVDLACTSLAIRPRYGLSSGAPLPLQVAERTRMPSTDIPMLARSSAFQQGARNDLTGAAAACSSGATGASERKVSCFSRPALVMQEWCLRIRARVEVTPPELVLRGWRTSKRAGKGRQASGFLEVSPSIHKCSSSWPATSPSAGPISIPDMGNKHEVWILAASADGKRNGPASVFGSIFFLSMGRGKTGQRSRTHAGRLMSSSRRGAWTRGNQWGGMALASFSLSGGSNRRRRASPGRCGTGIFGTAQAVAEAPSSLLGASGGGVKIGPRKAACGGAGSRLWRKVDAAIQPPACPSREAFPVGSGPEQS
jgi:hypothetical protein